MKLLIFFCITAATHFSLAAITDDGIYKLDKKHAHVGFSVSHLGISNVIGRFNSFDGNFVFKANGASSVNFEIDTQSVDTNQSRRDEHIRSADFFDVETYPKITYLANQFTYTPEGDPKTMTGSLTFHGVTKDVTFNVTPMGAGETRGEFHAGYKATGKLSRSAFGIDFLPAVVGDEIDLTINLEIIKE